MRGDATLFTRDDEVEAQWRIIDPILQAWARTTPARCRSTRPARSGPEEANSILRRRAPVADDLEHATPTWHGRRLGTSRTPRPSDIAAALQELLKQRHDEDEAVAPARVLNLVVIVDREWRGEILNRLERVGRYHPSRADPLRRRAAGAPRSTRGPRCGWRATPGPASWRSTTRRCSWTSASTTSRRWTRSWTRSW